MAGGVNAAIVPCMRCAGPARRTSEGLENDYYKCDECGYGFGMIGLTKGRRESLAGSSRKRMRGRGAPWPNASSLS